MLKFMAGAGLEDSWNPHSLRGAVTSKLFNLGIDEKRVLQFGRWSNVKTFRENYYRQSFYKEASAELNKEPLWSVIRMPVTLVDAVKVANVC